MKKINTIIIFILFGTNMFCQETCREGYDMINKLMQKSNSILRKDEISLPLYFRIQRSKRKTKEALKLAYRMLEENDCSVIDRIIELELKLGNPFKAEKIALDRLNDLNPNWRKKSSYVPTYYLSVLVQISRFDRKNSFYKGVRRNKGSHGVCGFTTYEQDVANLLWTAESLFNNYGPIFCLKFLQSSTIVINEDKQHLKMTWEKIYELLIQSMKTVYEYEEIKTLYESSAIQKIELSERERKSFYYGTGKSQFYFKFGEITIYFKTKECPDSNDRNKRCQPKNCKSKKAKSELYRIIKQYAS